jgi:hypothetical protein
MPDHRSEGAHPAEELLLYAYGELPTPARAAVEAHLATCEECRRELDGLAEVRAAVDALPLADVGDEAWSAMLRRATMPGRKVVVLGGRQRTLRRVAYPAIAAAALVTAGALGAFVLGATRAREVERLRAELADARAIAAVALMREPGSADRLRGVSAGSSLLVHDARISAAFARALRTDPSPNVRLAVLDAMEGAARYRGLEREILAALPGERLPAVRLAMIDLLERMGDAGARAVLESLALSDPDAAVRARARNASAALSSRRQSVQQ